MRRLPVLLAVLTAALAAACSARAATYYVSPGGSDAGSGTSPASAWRTVNKVNNARLAAGDTVLFQGGATFGDATLMPGASGSAGAPITFGSFGTGLATISNSEGAVWFSGKRYLTFDGLDLTTGGANNGVFAGSPGGGSDHIVLQNSVVENSGGAGVISPGHADSAWTIANSTFRNLGDSALILLGSDITVRSNTISHVGVNTAITYGKHGVYSKGPNQTIADNDISDVTGGQAVSVRFHGARVYGNRIHDTAYAFAFFDYDDAAAPQGTSYIYGNRAWNISGYGFYYDGQADANGAAPTVDFVVASNTFAFTGAEVAVNVGPSSTAHVTVANNIFTGTFNVALQSASTTTENHNLWHGAASGVPHNTGDTTVAPSLSASPALALPTGSALIDAGVAVSALPYTSSCNGSALSYCGAAPDLGAVESAAAAPAPAPAPTPQPLAPPTGLTAASVTATGLTLGWTASADTRTIGYRVAQNGNVVATPTGTSAAIGSLSCGTTYTFSVVAVDVTSSASSAATTTVTTAACPTPPAPAPAPTPAPTPDTTPPTLTITSPAANASVPLSVAVAAVASDGTGVSAVRFSVDGAAWCTDTTAPYACGVSLKAGWHTLTVKASDAAGNVTTKSIRVYASKRVRSVARVLSASPTNGTRVSTSFNVSATAVSTKHAPVVFALDGRAKCVDRTAPYACRLTAAKGWHVVAVRAGASTPVHLQLHVG